MKVPRIITAIQERVSSWSGFTLAWLSFLAAGIGGAAAISTFPGSAIRALAGMVPYHGGKVVAIVLAVAGICDLVFGKGFIPNRLAVYAAALCPSLWQIVGGQAGTTAHTWTAHINTWSQSNVLRLVGDGSLGFIALLCLVSAFMLSNRAARNLHPGAGDMAGAGMRGRP